MDIFRNLKLFLLNLTQMFVLVNNYYIRLLMKIPYFYQQGHTTKIYIFRYLISTSIAANMTKMFKNLLRLGNNNKEAGKRQKDDCGHSK